MLGNAFWQGILDGLGQVLSWIYDLIPNYGVAIIILTVLIRLLLVPLGIKQIRSMHAMQSVQPKIKAIQAKYKNNKQKAQEEIMKVYQEHGVNPLGGCLPLLLQMPVLIALYSVLRYPPPVTPPDEGTFTQAQIQVEMEQEMHVPNGSALQTAIIEQGPGVHFLGANLLCSAAEAGKTIDKPVTSDGENTIPLDCGDGVGAKLPIYFLIAMMVGSTYFQQWQMQRAAPPGSAQKQQMMIARIMPIMFLVFFWQYPSGMVLYWATSNVWQIGQQHFLLRAIKREAAAVEAVGKPKKPAKKGMMAKLMEQAEEQRKQQEQRRRGEAGEEDGDEKPKSGGPKSGGPKGGSGKSGKPGGKPKGGGNSSKKKGSGGK